jgi:serine/threonine-protein phosphatase 2B catalytic subunit
MASPRTQQANAIAAIQARGNHPELPEIDFTQHQLENGDVVSTTERVVKDVSDCFLYLSSELGRGDAGPGACIRRHGGREGTP